MEKILQLINQVRELNGNTPDGIIRDSDTILVDLLENADNQFTGFAEDIFQIYINSNDKPAVCQMFYAFTGVEFEDYLKQCVEEITRASEHEDLD